jgi:hypothetical protein
MAQIFKLRNARFFCFVLVAALLLGGAQAAPVLSLSLATPTVPLPAPPVETPTVTVKVTVPAPPPIKTPTVPVKTPTAPVKTPSVPVNTTTSPVKTTTSAKAPSISIKSTTGSVTAPSVSAATPVGSVHTTTGSRTPPVSATGLPGQSPSASDGPSRGTLTGGPSSVTARPGEGTPGASGGPASPAPLGAYGSPGAGFGELPPIEGAPDSRARARIAGRERRLKATVARFQGCLVALAASNRRLLELRTGYGEAGPLSPRGAAARLHLGAAQLAHREKQAVHELSEAAATRGCARTGEVAEAAISLIGAGLGGDHPGIARTELASFKASRPPASTPGSTLVGRVLGVDLPRVADDLILLLLLAMLGGTVVLLVADAAGIGPRHEQWRRRMVNRVRSMR